MAIHSSIFAWKIPWREESVGLQSTGLERVIHDWAYTSSLLIEVWTGPAALALPGHLWKKWNRRPHTQFSSVAQSLWPHGLFVTPWTAARQASLSVTNSWSLLKLMSIKSVMPSNHLVLCRPLLLLPSIFPSIRGFSNESVLHKMWPNIGVSASASVLPMNTQDWFPLGWTGWISLKSQGPHTRPTVNK